MEALDTNVVVRLLVRDDEAQCRRAEQLYRRAIAEGGALPLWTFDEQLARATGAKMVP